MAAPRPHIVPTLALDQTDRVTDLRHPSPRHGSLRPVIIPPRSQSRPVTPAAAPTSPPVPLSTWTMERGDVAAEGRGGVRGGTARGQGKTCGGPPKGRASPPPTPPPRTPLARRPPSPSFWMERGTGGEVPSPASPLTDHDPGGHVNSIPVLSSPKNNSSQILDLPPPPPPHQPGVEAAPLLRQAGAGRGTLEQCIGSIERFVALGATNIDPRPIVPDEDSYEILSNKIIPYLKSRG